MATNWGMFKLIIRIPRSLAKSFSEGNNFVISKKKINVEKLKTENSLIFLWCGAIQM